MMTKRLLLLLAFVLALCACSQRKAASSQRVGADSLRYARLLHVAVGDGDTVFTIADPWNAGRTLQTIVTGKADGGHPHALPTPLRRVVVFTTAHCQLLEYLGAADRIVGVCDAQFINITDIRRRVRLPEGARGKIEDCGSSMSPDVEKIIALKPDAIILSPYSGMNLNRLEGLGIPIIQAADYMETSSLGRAEWMKFYGRLMGCGQRADLLFHQVDSAYQSLKSYAAKLPMGRSVLTERKTGAVWYTPGGQSTIAATIRDAHGGYAFAADNHSGSLALSFEQILSKAGGSDIWAFKYNREAGGGMMTKPELLSEFQGYAALKAFRTGQIYECNCSVVPYFEEVSWRPDLLLREMIILLHPDAHLGALRYYKKLP